MDELKPGFSQKEMAANKDLNDASNAQIAKAQAESNKKISEQNVNNAINPTQKAKFKQDVQDAKDAIKKADDDAKAKYESAAKGFEDAAKEREANAGKEVSNPKDDEPEEMLDERMGWDYQCAAEDYSKAADALSNSGKANVFAQVTALRKSAKTNFENAAVAFAKAAVLNAADKEYDEEIELLDLAADNYANAGVDPADTKSTAGKNLKKILEERKEADKKLKK